MDIYIGFTWATAHGLMNHLDAAPGVWQPGIP
jgi:hypothetical protein